MIRYNGYQVIEYGEMVTDRPRMEPYAQALRQSVVPDCIVLDIGAGTGIFSLLACQLGAGQVHAIEPDDAIQIARTMFADNGYADRITFHQALSTEVTLPVRADVIISDLRGVLPLLCHHVSSIIDARKRLLAPGGCLIPQQDRLWGSLVEAPDLYRPYAEPWLGNDYDLDMRAGQRFAVNSWRRAWPAVKPEQLLAPAQNWATLDYATVEAPDVSGTLSWNMDQAGTAHGLAVWFDTILAENVGFSNAPGQPQLIYGQAFFPFSEPVTLIEGDRVTIKLQANLVADDYIWRWETRVVSQNDPDRCKAEFRQSTFFSQPVSPTVVRKKADNHTPSLKEEGKADRLVLDLMDGKTPLSEIAHRLAAQFPGQFPDWQHALAHVGHLSQKYSL